LHGCQQHNELKSRLEHHDPAYIWPTPISKRRHTAAIRGPVNLAPLNRQDYLVVMLLFVLALATLTAIQFLRMFEIAAVMAVFVAISAGVSRLIFRLTGSPPAEVK
jgi:hypothetical protein